MFYRNQIEYFLFENRNQPLINRWLICNSLQSELLKLPAVIFSVQCPLSSFSYISAHFWQTLRHRNVPLGPSYFSTPPIGHNSDQIRRREFGGASCDLHSSVSDPVFYDMTVLYGVAGCYRERGSLVMRCQADMCCVCIRGHRFQLQRTLVSGKTHAAFFAFSPRHVDSINTTTCVFWEALAPTPPPEVKNVLIFNVNKIMLKF